MWLFYYFNFQRNYDVLKPKSPCILLNKNINFNKNKMEWKITHIFLQRRILCFSSYKNRKLKVKLWWVGARERKKMAFFVPFILSERKLFKIRVLSQYIVYWIHFQNIRTFTYLKTLLHTLLLLVFKIVESIQCILNLIFPIKSFFYLTKKSRQNLKILRTKICSKNTGESLDECRRVTRRV